MYNRYIPTQTGFEAVPNARPDSAAAAPDRRRTGVGPAFAQQSTGVSPAPGLHQSGSKRTKGGFASILSRFGLDSGEGISQKLSGLLKSIGLENIDIGDILLALIVLFLILEDGDDLDLIIALGLMILFSLGET